MGTWLVEPGHTAAMFRARHMIVMYVRFKNVSGSLVFDPENPASVAVPTSEECRCGLQPRAAAESDQDADHGLVRFFS